MVDVNDGVLAILPNLVLFISSTLLEFTEFIICLSLLLAMLDDAPLAILLLFDKLLLAELLDTAADGVAVVVVLLVIDVK